MKLVTAEEWEHEFERRGYAVIPYVEDIAAIQRNAEQHTLERAAKAVCMGCRKDKPMCSAVWSDYHLVGEKRVRCEALAIKALFPENPAPAGKDTNDPACAGSA